MSDRPPAFSARSPSKPGRGRNILIVTRDPQAGAAAKKTLLDTAPDAGGDGLLTVEWAGRLSETLERLSRGRVDAVFLSLSLPDAEGLSAFSAVHRRAPGVPVILLGTPELESAALEAIRAGAQDVILESELGEIRILRKALDYAVERQHVRARLAHLSHKLRDASTRLEKLSLTDPLTELPNRRGLQESLIREVHQSLREGSCLLAVLVDLDDFKGVNDTWGFAAGDVLLKEAGRKIRECLRDSDSVARVGGDEFLILMPHTTLPHGARIVERLRMAIASMPVCLSPETGLRVTASFGMGAANEATSVEELLDRMFLLLKQSKKQGKNRVCFEQENGTSKRIETVGREALAQALTLAETYRAVSQPIFDLATLKPFGYEFLTRSCIEGFDLPDDFFQAAMEQNVLTLVDHLCFKTCLSAAASFPADRRRHLNLLPSTLLAIPPESLLEELADGARAGSYCVEMSEKQILADPRFMIEPIRKLKAAGVLVAIDDAGFGRTCLESLLLLEPDIIKIDKRCVRGVARQKDALERPLKRLLKVADALGAEVIAEGIETEGDLKIVRDLGVRYGQGFLWGRPS